MREETLLTPKGVAEQRSYLDWDTQPSLFKHYPDFCYRVPLNEHPSLLWLLHSRKITDERIVAHKPYRRLNVPSAGNLHPIEIYVQIRNVSGLLSGIYHLDVLAEELVMIAEIAGEGCEPFLGLDKRYSGMIVMLSLVPFRSGWKYGLRAWRYLYLDLGHQIGALITSMRHFGQEATIMSPQKGLNAIMGMGEDEMIAAVYGVGEMSPRPVKPLHEPLMRVQPTDYTLYHAALHSAIQETPFYVDIPDTLSYEGFKTYNGRRRSARDFTPNAMSDAVIQELMRISADPSLEILTVVMQAHAMHYGVYRNGKCAVSGNFISEILHLLLEQRFIAGANMVVLITTEDFCAKTHIEAGIYAQNLYMACEHHEVGCSGIGAFYDEEASRWTGKALLYAVAIGGRI
ncbi:nitroreductase family protein [Sulfuricurvum sp.]|uniref:nitroreductase family protein n=1 Tax=Sulfuricurvum sp. TaxID=2025608 RepID=UPI003BAF0137